MKIKSKLVGMTLVPLFISVLVVGFVSVYLTEQHLNEEQKTILKVALEGFKFETNT